MAANSSCHSFQTELPEKASHDRSRPAKKNPADPAQASEPVVSKPYVMPDDPEEGSVEALTREAAEARDKMLRTLAEMENLRQRTRREVSDAQDLRHHRLCARRARHRR